MLQNYLRKRFISCNFLERDDFDIYAMTSSVRETIGDFDDFFMVDEDHLLLAVDYVSEEGISVDTYISITEKLIAKHALASEQEDLTETEGSEQSRVSAWIGIMDLKSGELFYVNAKADPPVIKKDGHIKFLEDGVDSVLQETEGFKEYCTKMNKGDRLFLYSGRAVNADNENYSGNRLLDRLDSLNEDTDCKETVLAVRDDIKEFTGIGKQSDDLTLLAFDFTPKHKEKDIIERTFDATIDKLPEVIGFVEEQLELHDASMKVIMTISVALEEMFVNIAHYAYPDGPGKATIGVSFDGDNVSISLRDKGISFDPLAKEDPDVSAKAEDRQIGGLGIFMVKNSMDNCFYERRGDENYFVMTKRIR